MGPKCSSKKKKQFDNDGDGYFRKTTTLKDNLEKVFPKGSFYYNKKEIKLNNEDNLGDHGNLCEKINIFFKLVNHRFYDNSFKIKFMVNNNKQFKNFIDLGITESKMGEEIIFDKFFLLDYFFEKEQTLQILIICQEDQSIEYMVNITLGTLMGSKNLSLKQTINSKDDPDIIVFDLYIDAKNAKISKEIIKMKIDFSYSAQKNKFLKSYDFKDIFLVIANKIDGKNNRNIYKSEEFSEKEIIRQISLNEISLFKDLLCENDTDEILINFYDTKHRIFGSINTNLKTLRIPNVTINVQETNSKIAIASVKISIKEILNKTFVDYLSEGLQINLIIGIDFTASNGSPSEPKSLHFISTREPNFYERAIQSCGQIVSYYDYDKIYPVFGFGAQLLGSNTVNHCFNVNLQPDPNIYGLENIMKAYKDVIFKLNFSGPTYFTPLIRQVINMVKYNMINCNNQNYYILMILTDGQINDMPQTCDAIVEAAFLPISIIIIGIGSSDFTNMNILDGDEEPIISTKGEVVKRDIVQFVEFRKYEGDSIKLSEQVLEEIPRQVQEYYTMNL